MALFKHILSLVSFCVLISGIAYAQPIDASFSSPLVDAANKNDKYTLLNLLKSGTSANTKGDFGTTALMRAAYNGNIEICKILIDNKADANIKDIGGATALHIATRLNKQEVVEFLLKHGANPEIKDVEGYTSVTRAVKAKNLKIADAITNINKQQQVDLLAPTAPLKPAPIPAEKPHETEIPATIEPPVQVVQEVLPTLETKQEKSEERDETNEVAEVIQASNKPTPTPKTKIIYQSTVLDLRIYARKKPVVEEPEEDEDDETDANEPHHTPIVEGAAAEAIENNNETANQTEEFEAKQPGILETILALATPNKAEQVPPRGISVAEAVKLPDDIDPRRDAHLLKRSQSQKPAWVTDNAASKVDGTWIEVVGLKDKKSALKFWKDLARDEYFQGSKSKLTVANKSKKVKLLIGKFTNNEDALNTCKIVQKQKPKLKCHLAK